MDANDVMNLKTSLLASMQTDPRVVLQFDDGSSVSGFVSDTDGFSSFVFTKHSVGNRERASFQIDFSRLVYAQVLGKDYGVAM